MARGPVTGAGLAGLTIGFIVGLIIAWVLWPVEFTNADPADLRSVYKDDYVRMISAAFELDSDLGKARQRLSRLKLDNPAQTINALIAREKQTGKNSPAQTALTRLAQELSVPPTAQRASPSLTPSGPTPTATPTQPVPVFQLVERIQLTCQDEPETATLRFFARDAKGQDLPNVGIEIRWSSGDDTVYTGLKPERGVGFADYEAAPSEYSVTILNAQSASVSNLTVGPAPANCRADRGATPRGWKLIFQQK
ncbi:MAG: hypothetical protein HY782_21590 [Chloroflexi bacterium]|nr:hypothetical protein [Chloroflexota bacterium]